MQHLVKSIESIETEYKPFNPNISKEEQEALKKLITSKNIIIKPTDKDGGLILMDKSHYCDHLVNKEHLHSNIYKEVPLDSNKKSLQTVTFISPKIRLKFNIKKNRHLTDFK